MNIILFISDTFRRDHLPCYGNTSIITPNFDAFAKRSLVFGDCYPASFPTVPARADILTGHYTFLYQDWGPLAQDEITLPQLLSGAGYLTMGVADTPFLLRNGYGQDRGFQDFISIRGQRTGPELDDVYSQMRLEEDRFAPRTLKTAADWLERHYKEQFFLYIDTWDPHEPWDPPAYYVKPYYPEYAGEVIGPCYWEYDADGLTRKDVDIAHACYCGEISMVDRWFGFLLERLRTLGILEDTAIIFTSDHGFYFGEHEQFGKRRFRWPDQLPFEEGWKHGWTEKQGFIYRSPLHNEVTQVPLLVFLPGEDHRRIPGLVSLPDLMPTILELAGVEIPGRVQAKSMLPLVRGERNPINDIIVTAAPFEDLGDVTRTVDDLQRVAKEISPATITDGEWDLLYGTYEAGQFELYRTREDPGHLHNLIDEHREAAVRLHARFVDWLRKNGAADYLIKARDRI
jgi:arylsulfatase A-like enzyme